MRVCWRWVLALSLGWSGRLSAQELTPAETRALTDTLVRFGRELLAVARARRVDATTAFYGRRGEFLHVENGVRIRWPVLEGQMRQFMGGMKENRIRWIGDPSVLILGRDAAVLVGRHSFSGVDARGRPISGHEGEWTGVVQRLGGAWRVVHSHSSEARETCVGH